MHRRSVIFLVFVVAYFLSYFYRSTNAVIAGDLTRDLSLSASQLGLMTSLFFAAFALAQLPLGVALDRFGSRWTTPILMLAGVLGSLIFAAADSFGLLALGRALIGLGMAGILMGALKAFSGWFSPQRFATISGVFLALGASGALLATTPLAWLNGLFGWRLVFVIAAVITLISALAIMIFSRNAPERDPNPTSQGGFLEIFSKLQFWRIALLNFALVGSMFAYQSLWAGPFLTEALGLAEIAAANLLLVLSTGVVGGYLIAGWLADRFGLALTLSINTAVFILVQVLLALFRSTWPTWLLLPLFASFGLFGAFAVLCLAQARAVFPLSMTGRAVTAVNLLGIGGSALMQWGLGLLISSFAVSEAGIYPPVAYSSAFWLTSGLTTLALVFYLPMLRAKA